jgi:lipopolysaccharide exporter
MSLRAAAAEGAKWSAVSAATNAVIQFLQLAILARLLSPSQFGLVAIVMVILGFAQTYLDMGVSAAIIQRQDISRDQLSSLYWLNVFCGWISFGVTVAITPLAALLFREPYLLTVVPLAAVMFIVGPPGAQFSLLLQKRLRFRTLACIETAAALSGALIAIVSALMNLGVVAPIFGQLAAGTISSGILLIIGWRTWRPQLHFKRADIKGYVGFGLYQMGERTLNYLSSRADQLIIGLMLGPEALGYYSLAWNIVMQPVAKINPILTRVAFPLFAQVQDQKDRLKRGYLALIRALSAINAPLLFGCAAIAPIFVPLIYGPRWDRSILLVQVLAVVGLVRSIGNPIGTLLLSRGRADIGFMWTLSVALVHVPIVVASLYAFGLLGMTVAILLSNICYLLTSYPFVIKPILGECFKAWITSLAIPAMIAIVMAISVSMLSALPEGGIAALLAAKIVFGIVTYVGVTIVLQSAIVSEVKSIVTAIRW